MHKVVRWNLLKEEAIIFFVPHIIKYVILDKPIEINTIIWKLYKKKIPIILKTIFYFLY